VVLGTYHSASDNTPYPPTVSHVHDIGGADNSGNTVDRFWRIEVSGSSTANMVFSYTASESSGVVNPRAQLWEPVSAGWFPPSGAQSNPTVTTTQTNTNTTFNSWWALSSSSSPLPIQLLSFTANPFNRDVKLTWSTATEINNSHFTIQRSGRGDVFTDVLHVAGAGNSTTVQNYTAIDASPLPGVNYYRLKQTDFDGRYTYSNIRVVNMNTSVPVSIFPNPFRGSSIQVAVGEVETGDMEVELYDLAGKKVETTIRISEVETGGVVTLDLGSDLAPGAYMIEVKTVGGNFHQRIVKQ
jgi:Secretion system C-terminal sorting domain